MTASTLISDYFGKGTHAARPATPNVPSGATAFYYETDTGHTYAWNGAAWAQVDAAPASASVVQVAGLGANIGAVTMGSAPTSGNLLVALVVGGNGGNAATGWIKRAADNNGSWATVYYKVAGAGESTSQTPAANTGTGGVVIFEIAHGGFGMDFAGESASQSNAYTFSQVRTFFSGQLVIGAVSSENSNVPTSFSNVVSGGQGSFAGTHGCGYYYTFQNTVGVGVVVANWAANQWNDFCVVTIFNA